MENPKPAQTPLPTLFRLSDRYSPSTDEERELNRSYASAVGIILYAMVATRPDLAYVIEVMSRYMSNLVKKHWEDVKNIFKCLRGIKDVQLTFGSANPTEVEGYTVSDYATDNWKLTWGYIFTYGGDTILGSKLQECMTLSTIEAKYIAMSEATKEAIWLHRLSIDFSAKSRINHPTPTLHCDSRSAIHLTRVEKQAQQKQYKEHSQMTEM